MKTLKTYTLLLLMISVEFLYSQEKEKDNAIFFNEKAAIEQAKSKGIPMGDIQGYVQFLKNDLSSKRALKQQEHIHSPYENPQNDVQETVIYLDGNGNKPMSIGCPNMGFENYDFSGWTGGNGTVTTGPANQTPNYNIISTSITNSGGNNISVKNTTNYHTIMTIPPTSNVYPNCVGYDSLAARAVGTTTISDIPFISPYSFDGVSVRLNSANANNKAARLKYITTSSVNNQRISFSYAVVFHLPDLVSHPNSGYAPYFKVEVKDENTGTILPGCTSYSFSSIPTVPDPTIKNSVIEDIYPIQYREWKYYSVDLSSLPNGTSVSINFEVGGCSQGGHWGYAYVDAECGGTGNVYANMCSGSTFATLVAPTGFSSYQWIDGSGPIAGATNDTLIVNPATVGATYTVNLISPGGCALTQTVAINLTTVNIININSTNSCAGGASGSAYVQASGSNGIYTYTWTNTGSGTIVSNAQTATGLAPGTYSVLVASTTCGQASANLSVGVAPPFYLTQNHSFCGNSTLITKTGGSNYVWYQGTTLIPPPIGTNDSLFIANAVAGDQYTLVYSNNFGCRDSIKYTLTQIAGGSSYISNIANVCPGNANGSANINLNTPFSAPYSYTVTNTSGTTLLNTTTSNTLVSVSPLPIGIYTASIYDGVCFYNNTFTISTIQTNFTVTATNTVLCYPTDTAKIYLNFGASQAACGLDPIICSSANQITLFNAGPFVQNGAQNYPTPFGNYYTYERSQYLIRKTELNAAGITGGKLSSLAFNILNMNSSITSYPNYSIKMGCTNLTGLPDATTVDQPFISGLQTVYSTANQPISLGWVTHNFNQAYVWDGNSNIIVEVCFSMNTPSTWIPNGNASIELKQMSYIASMYHVEDANPVCGGTQLADNGFGSFMTNGINMLPNMKWGFCNNVSPSDYTVSVSSNGTITANYANDSLKVFPTFSSPPVPNAATVYTITVINPEGGCVATRTVSVLYPSLTTSISVLPTSNNTICIGTQVTLSASGAVDYDWSYMQGGSPVNIANTATVNVTPPAVGVNTYVVTGSSPCPSSIPDTKTITVTVIPKADLIISPIQDMTKCMNRDFVITTGVNSTSPNPGTPYTYNWTTLPGNTPAPGNNTSSSYTCSSNNTSTLVLTVGGACANSTSDTVVIKNFVDDLTVSIVDSSSTCANTAFTLNSSVSGGYPAYNYAWYIDGVSAPISTSANLAYTSPDLQGNYVVAVYVNDSCGYNKGAYETIIVLPPCSIEIPNIITPNGDGVNDVFVIKNLEHHPNTVVTVFDRWGRKIYENSNYNNEWKAEGSSDGTYFYVIDVPDDKKYSGFITVFKGK